MQVIRTIAELDQKIAECDQAEAISDEAMRAVFGGFRMELEGERPSDPFSPEYRLAQLDIYRQITGKPYSTAHEETQFDVSSALQTPFPFTTKSSATAGEYFMAIGFVLKSMALPPGSRVLEFGAGWGFTSLWLAQLGHHVTVIDIEPCFCELIRRRGEQAGVEIDVINAEFFWVEETDRTFDAVLFYDCFHHCDDHMRLLRGLSRVVAPEGRIFFGAEPIRPDFSLPWGLRLDGWSLWGIRKNGWMELGFRDDYFSQALARAGWFGRKIALAGADRLRMWEARHRAAAVFKFPATDPRIQTQIGVRRDAAIVFDRAEQGTGLYGPYIDLPAGKYVAKLRFRDGTIVDGRADLDVVCHMGERRLAQGRISESARIGSSYCAEITFASETDLDGLEVRLFASKSFSATFEGLEIVPSP